jgi:hypothetical protein
MDAILAVQPFFPDMQLNSVGASRPDCEGRVIPVFGKSHVEQRWHFVGERAGRRSRLEEEWVLGSRLPVEA